jgi:hypothetical protein
MQRKKIIAISVFLIFIFPFVFTLIPNTTAQQQEINVAALQASDLQDTSEIDTIQITASDLIKNFRFYKFGNDYINPATNTLYDGRLIFEIGTWKSNKDDLNLEYKYTIGNRTYLFYTFKVSSAANIYTNCRLPDCAETHLNTTTDRYLAGTYNHKNLWGLTTESWKSYLDFEHYDFGDIIDHNAKYNTFGGALQMQFDINSGVLPATLTNEGSEYSKVFDYIGVDTITASAVEKGYLSSDNPNVTIAALTPREYESQNRSNTVGGEAKSDMNGLSNNYDPNIDLTIHDNPTVTYQEGMQHTSVGASLNPLTKDGDPIWDADDGKSVENCSYSFNVGSISPKVQKYTGTLSYNLQKITTKRYVKSILPWKIESHVVSSSDIAKSHTEDVALKVTNTYMRPQIEIIFNLYTCFEMEEREAPGENLTLDRPSEDFEEIGWHAIVDGYGGASTFEQFIESDWVSDLLAIQAYQQALEDGTLTGEGGSGTGIKGWWRGLSLWGKIGIGIAIIVGVFVAIGAVQAIRASNQAIKRRKRQDEIQSEF